MAQSTVFDFPASGLFACTVDAKDVDALTITPDSQPTGTVYFVTLYGRAAQFRTTNLPLADAQAVYDLWRQRLDLYS